MLTTDEQALMNTIVATPDDDAPRLIYADWLEENGQAERAEFIRVQCELARLPEWVDRATLQHRQNLKHREIDLFAKHGQAWTGKTLKPSMLFEQSGEVAFRRGFVEEGRFLVGELCSLSQDIVSHPLLRQFTLLHLNSNTLKKLLALPWIDQFVGLRINAASSVGDELLMKATKLSHLKSLHYQSSGFLTNEQAQLIAANAAFDGVRDLALNVIQSESIIDSLLSGPAFAQLKQFKCTISWAFRHFATLLSNPRLATLESLQIIHARMDRIVIESLINSPFWSQLRTLKLTTYPLLGDEVALLGAAHASQLETLSLTNNLPVDCETLVGPILQNVKQLELNQQTQLSPFFLKRLANSNHTRELRSLRLRDCPEFGDTAAEVIANTPGFRNLRTLDLSGCHLTLQGAFALANSPYLDELTCFTAWGCPLESVAKKALHKRFPIVHLKRN